MGSMPISNVGGVIIRCWMNAEEAVCNNLPRDSDEDQITNLFRGELEKELEKASNSGGVEAASHPRKTAEVGQPHLELRREKSKARVGQPPTRPEKLEMHDG